MRVSSFKSQYRQAPPRAATPPRPVYEPLSPILQPLEPYIAKSAGGKEKAVKHNANGDLTAIQHPPAHTRAGRPPLQLSPPTVTNDAPLRSAPLPRSNPQYSPSLGSPIDALANAAVSSLQASPAYFESSRRPSHGPISPATAVPRPHTHDRVPKHSHAEGAYSYDERPSKRARSEFLPSPRQAQRHSRPATSHMPGWSYNVEQMVDNGVRMYQDNTAPAYHQEDHQSKRLSDAQLLLDFHNAVSASPTAPPSVPATKRWSVSHLEASGKHATHMVFESTSPYLSAPYSDAKTYDQTYPPRDENHVPAADRFPNASPTQYPLTQAVQTHTPPEESLSAIVPHTADEGNIVEEKKAKKHQGWPKGKPRGPRTGTAADKKKKATPKPKGAPSAVARHADQLHSPQSLPANEPEIAQVDNIEQISPPEQTLQRTTLQPRRHSHSNINATVIQTSQPPPLATVRAQSVPLDTGIATTSPQEASQTSRNRKSDISDTTICAGCNSSDSTISIGDGEQWINCDGCKGWFHYACAGFTSEREVREIDKFYCSGCKPKFGETTKVRKSARAHTAVDYAGLNEGILKTSDDNPEHHYIQAFKNGELKFLPETFARLPPECVTADFIEKMNGFTEPVVVPASLNPRPKPPQQDGSSFSVQDAPHSSSSDEPYGYEMVLDDGQDRIDMVIPEGLTVRRVSELYGPSEPVPVIDVKAQEGEDKRWTMAKWADYYEQAGEKPVRNVISLEVSRSRLGRLIRRPKVVRDMDLQDSVWPEDDKARAPPVQFYCLMSVADCYTDFHIDFGGSSVYYHIIKGKKTFFFIPPTKSNLKKYEDWCLSQRQSHEFLGLQVKECYRVDLSPGDTMLIPSGWIHAVWTPEDSLVIGGNYLTRCHYGMQIKVLEIEKNTKVAPKFRYPFFQKIMWLSLIRYLEDDPLPPSVENLLLGGEQFERSIPIFCEVNKFGHNSDLGPENYNRRYYPKAELEGLPDLANYIWRTVMISQGRIEGITQQTRNAVTRSIPKGHGEPLILARRFAMWIAWKRGNERIPQWAHPDSSLPEASDSKGEKKLSAAQLKKLERESWNETLKLVRGGERHSSLRARVSEPSPNGDAPAQTQVGLPVTGFLRPLREHVTTPKTSQLGPKRIACDACRKRRIRCKHKDEIIETPGSTAPMSGSANGSPLGPSSTPSFGTLAARRYSDADVPSGPVPYPIYDAQSNTNGGPVSADLNTDALANKSGRVKACADCRKSKRRCIHDEHGNVDPVKAAEAPVPRGSASKKRRISDEHDGEAMNKKLKRESFAGLVDGEISQWNRYPLSKPRAASATEARNSMAMQSAQEALDAMDHTPSECAMIDPQLTNDDNDILRATSPHQPVPADTIITSIEQNHEGEPMDGVIGSEPVEPQIDPQLLAEPRTPAATNTHHNGLNGVHPNYFHGTSSISPGQSLTIVQPSATTPTMARPPSSRASATPHKPSQTPRPLNQNSTTPRKTPGSKGRRDSINLGTIKVEPGSGSKPRAMSSTERTEEDMASLQLALKLQMEEHGLRRRSK